jgi:hypothetical protein
VELRSSRFAMAVEDALHGKFCCGLAVAGEKRIGCWFVGSLAWNEEGLL